MAEIDIEKYTTDILLKNLVLIELHLAEFSNSPLFCAECLSKHYLILSGASQECIGVCYINRTDVWQRLGLWADNARAGLSSLSQEQAEKLKAEARDFRKELEELSGVVLGQRDQDNFVASKKDSEIHTNGHLSDSA